VYIPTTIHAVVELVTGKNGKTKHWKYDAEKYHNPNVRIEQCDCDKQPMLRWAGLAFPIESIKCMTVSKGTCFIAFHSKKDKNAK